MVVMAAGEIAGKSGAAPVVIDVRHIPDDIRIGDEDSCIGRNYFACAPDSDVWVWFGDLPKAVYDRLWAKYESKLTFPARFRRFCRFGARRTRKVSAARPMGAALMCEPVVGDDPRAERTNE